MDLELHKQLLSSGCANTMLVHRLCLVPPWQANQQWHTEHRQSDANLDEVSLGLFHTSHISKGDASVGLHLEFGLALAKIHGVVASWAAHAAPLPAGQQEQTPHKQQRECKVACEYEGHCYISACYTVHMTFVGNAIWLLQFLSVKCTQREHLVQHLTDHYRDGRCCSTYSKQALVLAAQT